MNLTDRAVWPLTNMNTSVSNPLRQTALEIVGDFNSAMSANEGSIDEDIVGSTLERFYECCSFSYTTGESATYLTRGYSLGVFRIVWEDTDFQLNLIKLLLPNFWDINGIITTLLGIVKDMDILSPYYCYMTYSIGSYESLVTLGRMKTKELYLILLINMRRKTNQLENNLLRYINSFIYPSKTRQNIESILDLFMFRCSKLRTRDLLIREYLPSYVIRLMCVS
jgi:hypothetical protein